MPRRLGDLHVEQLPRHPVGVAVEDDNAIGAGPAAFEYPVRFDIHGDGRKESLDSWPAASAGILVWDPEGTGEIGSGAQWFGTFGFRMIWRDGYEALDAFDDDRDGWLRGAELKGIAVWHDHDGDAVSGLGEVSDATEAGIRAIAVRPEREIDGVLENRAGVRWSDGKLTPSYDWIVGW